MVRFYELPFPVQRFRSKTIASLVENQSFKTSVS